MVAKGGGRRKKKGFFYSCGQHYQECKEALGSCWNQVWRYVGPKFRKIMNPIAGVVIGGPAYLANQYYQVSSFADHIRLHLPGLAQFLDDYIVVGLIVLSLWGWIALKIYKAIDGIRPDTPSGWEQAPDVVLKALDNVVGAKEQRFNGYLKQCAGVDHISAQQIFKSITQPSDQLSHLTQAIFSSFALLLQKQYPNGVLKVHMAMIDGTGKIYSIPYICPNNHPPRSTIAQLNNSHSAIRRAVSSRKIVVLASTKQAANARNPRFVVTNQAFADEDGALICYPIISTGLDNRVAMVVSVYIDQPNAFRPKYADTYEQLLLPFALRIKLEYTLIALKELPNEQE